MLSRAFSRSSALRRRMSSSSAEIGRVSNSILGTIPQSSLTDSLWGPLRSAVQIDPKTLVVIDDDPTGCQTVYGVNVLLDYSVESIRREMERPECKMFYVLTNTRGLPEADAVSITSQVVENIHRAQFDLSVQGKDHGARPIQIVSRSDSTLRGHYPAETQAIIDTSPETFDATILIPAFFEGGRVTFHDVHYLTEGEHLVPVGETPFARDPHFGYHASNLIDWVVEKHAAAGKTVDRTTIVSITLDDIRQGGPHHIADKLESLQHGSTVIVNAVHQHDLNIFVLGLLHAEGNGFNFLYRTAASFVASRAGLEPKGLVTLSQLGSGGSDGSGGGLVVVGSYVPKSTAQLRKTLAELERPGDKDSPVVGIEVNVADFLSGNAKEITPSLLASRIDAHTQQSQTCVLYTSRLFVENATLQQTAQVSKLLTDTVASLRHPPAFLVAKGGITSHDVAAHGLHASTCEVVGQVEPGVPLWRMGPESRFPGMPYVVFPGNVGDDDALLRVISKLQLRPRKLVGRELGLGSAQLVAQLAAALLARKAVPAFNVYNLEGAKAAVETAELFGAPVMLQVHPASLKFGGSPLLRMLAAFKASATVPVFIHLDHATEDDEGLILMALEHGVDSIMVDGSAMPFEDNMRWTAKMAALAHDKFGCVVEAELGRLVGEEDGLSVDEKEGKMTDPASVPRFLAETKVDLLAVTIGNVHGKYLKPPQLDFRRLEAIRDAAASDAKLVLHGASGLPQDQIKKAMELGVCKFNVNTDLREAAMDVLRRSPAAGAKLDVLPLMQESTKSMSKVAADKFTLFGW